MWFEDTLPRLMSQQIGSVFSEEVPSVFSHPEFSEGSSEAHREEKQQDGDTGV